MEIPPPVNRRLRLALIVSVVLIGVMLVLVTPYSLHRPEQGMIHPYQPPPLASLDTTYRRLRDLTPHLPVLTFLGAALLSIATSVWLYRKRKDENPRSAVHDAGLIFAVGIALTGQTIALNRHYGAAGLYYLLAAISIGAWMWLNRARLARDLGTVQLPRRVEAIVFIVLILVTFVARFYELRRIPYGIEGDEAKWTVEIASVMVDHTHALSSDWHFGGVPGSFYMQAPFQKILGPGLLSARIAVATYSVLATLVFYWFARSFFNVPVAILATGFLSVSMLDLSASRLALVEGHNKLWVITGPALLMLALRHRRWWLFALAGGAFGLGIVTYDTYLPMLGVGVAILLIDTVLHFWQTRSRDDLLTWIGYWAAFLLALGVFFGRALYYINGRGGDYKLEDVGWKDAPVETLLKGLGRTLRAFAAQVDRDFLHTRDGPLINSVLVPLMVIGVVGCLIFWRKRQARLPLIWAGLVIFPVPVVLHIAYPRVLYPSLPALYLLAAVGAYWLLHTVWGWLGEWGRAMLVLGLAVGGIAYGTLNLYTYFNQLNHNDSVRVTTREMSDFLLHYADKDRLILVPYIPLSGDLVEGSGPWYDFYLRQSFDNGTQAQFYQLVPYDDLLTTVTDIFESGAYGSVALLVDTNVPNMGSRELILDNVRQCYHTDVVWARSYARLMLFNAASQTHTPCYGAHVSLTPSTYESFYSTTSPPRLHWSVSNGNPLQAALECQHQRDQVYFLEAEEFDQLRHYQARINVVPDASGRVVITDEPGSDAPLASTTVELDQPGLYRVWVRTYRILDDGYPPYLSIEQSEALPFSVDPPLYEWVWEMVGEFDLPAGETYLTITRPYEGEKPFGIYMDAVALSSDEDYAPGTADNGRWETYVPGDPVDLPTPGVRQGIFPAVEWEPGIYRCRAGVWDGQRMRDNQGQVGAWSDWFPLTFVEPPAPEESDDSPPD